VTEPTPARQFPDMWVDPDDDPREGASPITDERSMLLEYLRTQRLTLAMKCAGLDAAGMAMRSIPPSTLSLLGLLRHMAEVERHWSRRVMAGEDAPRRYSRDGERDGDFDGAIADDAVVADAWAALADEQAFTDRFVAATPDLGFAAEYGDGERIELRELLIHLVREYAHHAGHADLLRECVDGRVGQ
jgi:uncharacterized damage-inducible protein DinB